MRKSEWMVVLAVVLALCLPVPSFAGELAQVDLGSAAARWNVQGDFAKVVLTVSLPNGSVMRREFKGGDPVVFELDAAAKDGSYTYELRGVPHIDASVRKELAAARKAGNEAAVIERLQEAGRLPRESAVQSGAFLVKDGAIVSREGEERPRGTAAAAGIGVITAADQVIPDDLIVQGSACVGLDCVVNENFGFDTIRLKENNLRIHFDDTSTQAGFPANDWRLIANDSAGGGSSKFSIEDSTSAKTPFTITAGATTNSIFVDSTGRVGFRTSTPVLDLHVNTSNTPAIRLEQNNTGGFTAQTWDIGANEANFFIRDVTGGSLLSMRIRPGAPTSSLDISSDGDVGIGTGSPDARLHVFNSSGGDAHLHIEETNGTVALRTMLELENNGASRFNLVDNNAANTWTMNNNGGTLNFLRSNSSGVTAMAIQNTGAVTIAGALTQGSSREIKTNFALLEPKDVLSRVTALPISLWSYKTEGAVRHIGPMAEDFHKFFGLGEDERHIAPSDQAGVALLAVQGLNQVVQEKDKEIADLKSRIETLEKLVQSLASAGPQQ
jgi:hypothetical protein